MPKRKAPSDEDDRPQKYASLKPRTAHVARATVRKRWATLPETSQNKVKELIRSGERPAIMVHREEKRRLEAQRAIGEVLTT